MLEALQKVSEGKTTEFMLLKIVAKKEMGVYRNPVRT